MKTFSVKNFERFQHYKDRAPPWIKLYNELLDDYEFGALPDASKFHLVAIWLLASRSENKIPYDPKWVARRINANDDVDLDALVSGGFILFNQELHNSEHVDSEPLSECLYREEGEGEDIDKRRGDSRSIEVDLPIRDPSRFDDFWKVYPRREGPNPRQPAEKKFDALVKSGVDPEMMIAAAKNLASSEISRGNVGTRFIPQALTWLNQQRWADHAAIAFLAEQAGAEMPIEKAVQIYAKLGRWSKYAGPSPGQTGCRATNEMLEKHGLDQDGNKIRKAG